MPEDSELLREFAASRSEQAFAELVRRNLDLVYATALRKLNGDRHRAEDVCQVVLIKLARNASTLSRHPALAGWLHTAAHYAALSSLRADRRREKREREVAIMEESACDREVPFAGERLAPLLDDALQELGGKDREAVLLRFFQGRSYVQIGAQMGLGDSAARMRVERALDKLQRLLVKRGFAPGGVALGVALASHAQAAPAGLVAEMVGRVFVAAAASGGTGGGLIAFSTLMTTSKSMVGIALAAAVIAIGSAVYEASRAEQLETLRSQVAAENGRLRSALQISADSAKGERSRSKQLQAEIDRRKLGDEVTKSPPTAMKRPVAGGSGDLVAGMSIQDVGNVGRRTPSAGFQSWLWAITRGNNDDIADAIALTGQAKDEAEKLYASLPSGAKEAYGDPAHLMAVFAAKWATDIPVDAMVRIVSQHDQDAEVVVVHAQVKNALSDNFPMQNGPNGWQLLIPVGVVRQAAAQLTAN